MGGEDAAPKGEEARAVRGGEVQLGVVLARDAAQRRGKPRAARATQQEPVQHRSARGRGTEVAVGGGGQKSLRLLGAEAPRPQRAEGLARLALAVPALAGQHRPGLGGELMHEAGRATRSTCPVPPKKYPPR